MNVIERDLSEPDRILGELLEVGEYLKLVDLVLKDKQEHHHITSLLTCTNSKLHA